LRRGHRTHAGMMAQLAIGRREEVHALEPPVTEQLRIERRDDDPCSRATPPLLGRDAGEQVRGMTAMLADPAERGRGPVRPSPTQIRVGSRHPPELAPARPAALAEHEVPLSAPVALPAAPGL